MSKCTRWVDVETLKCKAWVDEQTLACAARGVPKWLCIGCFWLVKAACTLWSWVAKLVCVMSSTALCWVNALARRVRRRHWRAPRVRHVFVLMLENRSFDHMLGFSGIQGSDPSTGNPTSIEGLIGNPHSNVDPVDGEPIPASTPADFKIPNEDGDPGHGFDDVLEQLCGKEAIYPDPANGKYPPINNSGFIASYRDSGSAHPKRVMKCFPPERVPVINALAREFAVCDHWFSSMPGPTWPNRFFIHAASSGRLDDSPSGADILSWELIDGYRFENGTIFDRLDENCIDWEIFEGDEFPQSFAISGMHLNRLEGRFTHFERFADKVNDAGYSPSYIFIEPNYGNLLPGTSQDYTCGTSQHPLDDVTRGEALIKEVYETIRNSPLWESSVLIVTYDEHGGFYDHVAPPATTAPGDTVTDLANNKHNFDFKQLGVRVPAVVISPLVPRNTIDQTVYDHSSVLATVERLFGLKPLTKRDATANDFLHLFKLPAPRIDAPTVLPDPAKSGFRCIEEVLEGVSEPSASLTGESVEERENMHASSEPTEADGTIPASFWGFLHVALRKQLSVTPIRNRKERKRIIERFMTLRSEKETRAYRAYIRQVRQRVREKEPWRAWRTLRLERDSGTGLR